MIAFLFFQNSVFIHFDFVIQYIQSFLHFFHSGHKQFPLLYQNFFSGFNGLITLLNQCDILDQHFNGKPGAPHALNEFNPPEIEFVVIPDAAFVSIYRRDEPNTFIVTKRI